MRLLFFTEQSPFLQSRVGGAETSMRLIAEGLAARGHRVAFASLRPDRLPFSRRMTENGVEVLLVPNPRRAPLARLKARLPGRGGRLGTALDARGWRRVRDAVFGGVPGGVLERVLGGEIDLVYAFYEMEFLAGALAARARNPGMAVVMRMAGLGWLDALRRGGGADADAAEYARVFGAVDAINYLSESSRALIEARAAEAGVPLAPRASFVADIGVSASRVPAGWQGPSAGPGLDIVLASRFDAPQKRQDLIVEAAGLLKGRLPLKITMIGNGRAREAVTHRRDALGLGETVEIRPFMAQEELWAAMRRADLLCHPCEHEGVSKIILEAMMLGLPVLASDVPPLPDYVIEGATGYRVANTPEAWAAKLVEIAAAKERLAALSARARAFVEATYDKERNVGRYETAFQALVDARRAAVSGGQAGEAAGAPETPETGPGPVAAAGGTGASHARVSHAQ